MRLTADVNLEGPSAVHGVGGRSLAGRGLRSALACSLWQSSRRGWSLCKAVNSSLEEKRSVAGSEVYAVIKLQAWHMASPYEPML
jgi:hypothetical protein